MELLLLVGQRKCAYAGQYAPEALAVIDTNGNDETPEYMQKQLADYRESGEFDSLVVMRIRVPWASVTEALYPASKTVEALAV